MDAGFRTTLEAVGCVRRWCTSGPHREFTNVGACFMPILEVGGFVEDGGALGILRFRMIVLLVVAVMIRIKSGEGTFGY